MCGLIISPSLQTEESTKTDYRVDKTEKVKKKLKTASRLSLPDPANHCKFFVITIFIFSVKQLNW